MSNFSDFIGGGGGGGLPVNIILGHSQTWVPPVDGNICIHVVGAGGGGQGADSNATYSGGAGGYCKKNSLAVTTSGSFTVVIGAGGAGGYNAAAGTTGGNTTVAGTGLSATLTANGGVCGFSGGHGAGGTASNGDVNNTGGAGEMYGGGAVGITGTGLAGGGGATYQQGGSCDVVGPESLMGYGYICGGIGGRSMYSFSGANSYGNNNTPPDGTGGFLAGGGSYWMDSTGIAGQAYGGHGGIGGGGGRCNNDFSDGYSTGGRGGNGIVIIQYLPA
jgi:hypothetical protein